MLKILYQVQTGKKWKVFYIYTKILVLLAYLKFLGQISNQDTKGSAKTKTNIIFI